MANTDDLLEAIDYIKETKGKDRKLYGMGVSLGA